MEFTRKIKDTIKSALGLQIADTAKKNVDERKPVDETKYSGMTLFKKLQRRAVTRRNIEGFNAPAGTKGHRRFYYLYNPSYFSKA